MKSFIYLLLALALFGLINISNADAQVKKTDNDDSFESMFGYGSPDFSGSKINADAPSLFGSLTDANVHSNVIPLEGKINPEKYIVGPNDLFTLGVYGFINQQVPLYVSPEGTVIIPTVGEVMVSDLTLAEARSRVIATVKKRYYSSDVSFTLTMPRTFIVKVSGLTQGSFEATSTMRISDLVKRIFYDTTNVSRFIYKSDNDREHFITQPSLRNIELIRDNGTRRNVDIYKYYMTNDDKYNPTLLDGDMIKIPNVLLQNNYITVTGAVQLGGTYEWAPGDNLETLIGLGRGFDMHAEPDSILLYRPYGEAKDFEIFELSYERDKDFEIKPYDRAFVKFKSDYKKKVTVLVLGEVQRPGYYPISFKTTRIKDVIEMAGGLTENAYLPLSILFRDYDLDYTENDTAQILINQRANDVIVSEKDKDNFWSDFLARRNRVIVDYEKLFKENDQTQNVILEDNDIIYINDNKNIVYVYGQVQAEGYIPYKPGEDVDYYIERAGGYSLAADEGNTRIIKFNSRGWYEPGEVELRSGDFIYVQRESKIEFKDWITIVAQISAAIVGIISAILIYVNTKKD